jgi:hypothetical protein
MRACFIAAAFLLVGAAPARAENPFTVTAADSTVYGSTAAELDHWTEIAQRSGSSGRDARRLAFQLLVGYAWLRGEGTDRGLVLTHEQVVGELRRQREVAFRTRRAFRRFLRESGQTVGDVLRRVRTSMLSDAIRRQVTAGAVVTETEVDAHLAEHGIPRRPERRDLRIVLTQGRDAAVAAKPELLRGASWGSVAKRYSIDAARPTPGPACPTWSAGRSSGGSR